MKIIYAQNPLCSYIELSPGEVELFKAKLYSWWLNDMEEDEETSKRYTEHQFPYLLEAITSGEEHMGDCTKVACSCTKCFAEEVLGVSTTDGVKQFRTIRGAFVDRTTSIGEAITFLSKPGVYSMDWHAPWVDKWEAERVEALESLIAYRDRHFPEGGEHGLS